MKKEFKGNTPGKGDKPRNCFSKEFKNNYDLIKWSSNNKKYGKSTENKS